jgi:hypothetical protein
MQNLFESGARLKIDLFATTTCSGTQNGTVKGGFLQCINISTNKRNLAHSKSKSDGCIV